MKSVFVKAAAVLVTALVAVGCGHEGGEAVVLDLGAIAQATGQDELIRARAEEAREELGAQLQQLAITMDQQIAAQQAEMGESPTAEQEAMLQQMTMQARQQLGEAQAQAQAQATQIEEQLIEDYRAEIQPLAQEIARSKGASIVFADDSYLFWYDDSLDITDEVIAAWRALPDDSADEDVAEELAEVEEQIEVLEEAFEGAQEAAEEDSAATE